MDKNNAVACMLDMHANIICQNNYCANNQDALIEQSFVCTVEPVYY